MPISKETQEDINVYFEIRFIDSFKFMEQVPATSLQI